MTKVCGVILKRYIGRYISKLTKTRYFFGILALLGIYLTTSLLFSVKFTLFRSNRLVLSGFSAAENPRPEDPKQACVLPRLIPNHPALMKFFKEVPPVHCDTEKDWVYTYNGTFFIYNETVIKHGDIQCAIVPIVRGSTDFKVSKGSAIKVKNNTKLTTDFFKAACVAKDGSKYQNYHATVGFNAEIHERFEKARLPKEAMGLNVLMFGYDSVSRMNWLRKLKKSHDYLIKELKGILLEGYNIVGDGTPQALLPILTGKTEVELPESRRGKAGAKSVDHFPWIWNTYKEFGYVTQWAEDMAGIGTFQFRLLGFDKQPTDHNMRPFYLEVEPLYKKFERYCLGSLPRHTVMTNWIRDTFLMYQQQLKWVFGFYSETSHGNSNDVQATDEALMVFLKFLYENNYLNNTILILMSDHGARFHEVRDTVQGKLEERMPYFAFRFPEWFEQKYPKAMRNFRINSQRLTTPFDIHETFHDILDYKGIDKGDIRNRGISLFREIPVERSCSHAAIEPHWCSCLEWQPVSQDDINVKHSIQALIEKINGITEFQRPNCALLSLSSITRVNRFTPNKDVLGFLQSKDTDGRVPDLSDKMQAKEIYYQVTIKTAPGDGQFEATVKHDLRTDKYVLGDKDISRTNLYGSAPDCVAKYYPHLRPYCYCNNKNMTTATG